MKKLMVSLMLLVCAYTPALAEQHYNFDTKHTNIMWFADHFGFSKSMGQFMDYDGHMTINTEKPEKSSVDITIRTGSVMTGIDAFDTHLRSADFFDIQNYPEARFVSKKIVPTDDTHATIHGELTLLGVTKPIELHAVMNKIGLNLYNKKETVGFTVEGTIRRSDFGMNYGLPGISDEVNILIEAEGVRN